MYVLLRLSDEFACIYVFNDAFNWSIDVFFMEWGLRNPI